jgi:hypothetical protein
MRADELLAHDCAAPSLLVRFRNKARVDREHMCTWFIQYVQNTTHVVHNRLVFALMEEDWDSIEYYWSLNIVRECAALIVEFYE